MRRKSRDYSIHIALGTLLIFIIAIILYSIGFFDKRVYFADTDIDTQCKKQGAYALEPDPSKNWQKCLPRARDYPALDTRCRLNFCYNGICKSEPASLSIVLESSDNFRISPADPPQMPRILAKVSLRALGYNYDFANQEVYDYETKMKHETCQLNEARNYAYRKVYDDQVEAAQ